MNYCAIISEFNPLTNGHKYIIEKAKQETNLDVLCLMSGNFVQRGEIAILNKYERATTAIENGANIVLELPLVYSISSAEMFASGAIKILKGIPHITHLAFGIETQNTLLLETLAKLKVNKNNEIKEIIKKESKNGTSYSKGMLIALKKLYPNNDTLIDKLFLGANNVLALEYLAAIYREKANITPVYINRTDGGYNSSKITKTKIDNKKIRFASASYIRELANTEKLKQVKNLVPQETYNNLTKQSLKYYQEKQLKLDTILLSELRKQNIESLSRFYDYSQSLAGLIYKLSQEKTNNKDIVASASGKSFRPARIRKLLLYPSLQVTKENFEQIYNSKQVVNVLAVEEDKKQDLTRLKNTSSTNLIVSIKDYNNETNKTSLALNQLSSDVYNLVSNQPITKDKTLFVKK